MSKKKIVSLSGIIICLLLLIIISLWLKDSNVEARCVEIIRWGSTLRINVSGYSGAGDYYCPGGYVMTGVSYHESGDEHITDIFCTQLNP